MYEIIWSSRNDAYIIRPVCTYSTIKPEFIGSFEECKKAIKNHQPSI
jgi:hypothetical protein